MNARRILVSLIATTLLASPALLMAATPHARDMSQTSQPAMQSQDTATRPMRKRIHVKNIKGRHFMPGTVTAVDHNSGIVKLNSLGMALVVHFPPPSIKDLKAGDEISLLLGYRMVTR
jgi:hypothetical protein